MAVQPYQIKITAKTADEFELIKKKVDCIHPELVKCFDQVENGIVGLMFKAGSYQTQDHLNLPRNFAIKRVGFRPTQVTWGNGDKAAYVVETYGTFKPEDEEVKAFDAIFTFISLEPSFEVKSF